MKYASVCDGIGAAHVAWQPLGWQCEWTSEIEPFPAAVVEHHYGLRNLGDMTAITEEMLDEPVDLLVGGTPCQSFSVAGLRGGLADPRGNLALRFVQLAAVMQPRWIVWENVPGVLSSGKGRDFGAFLGALGELGYGFAYRVLDAQWFGVAQRRRRVFVVGHLGDWRRAAAVLFERESVFGNPPTRGKAWEGVATATPISTRTSRSDDRGDGCDNLVAFHPTQDPISSVDGSTHALGCGSKGGCCTQAVAFSHSAAAHSYGVACVEEGTPPLRGGGAGNSMPAVAYAIDGGNQAASEEVHHSLRTGRDSGDAVAFKPSHYTRGKDGAPSEVVAQGFTCSGYSNQPAWMTGDRTDCLPASGHSDGSHQGVGVVSVRTAQTSANGHGVAEDVAHTIDRAQGQAIAAMSVRRLTPRECERLQGFPDDYTLVTYRNKPAADGPRYRALGNSMAVPVMRWIGERIAKVDTLKNQGAA
jgi:DNA (cytosine-5)-methyltransferase 1